MSDAWITSYSYSVEVEPVVGFFADSDTIRGGKQVVIHGNQALVDTTQDVSFAGQTMPPTGWTSVLTGTGRLAPSPQGLSLQLPDATASSVLLTSPATYKSFEAALSARLLSPTVSSSVDSVVLGFEFRLDADNYVGIRVVRPAAYEGQDVVEVRAYRVVAGQATEMGAVRLATSAVVLKIVRHSNYVFAFVNAELLDSSSFFTTATTGAFRVSVAHALGGLPVETRLSDLTIRSHALINGRLLQEKTDISKRRFAGNVPAASLSEVGLQPIILFGPWGSVTSPEGFEYTLPTGRTVGRAKATTLRTFNDPTTKD